MGQPPYTYDLQHHRCIVGGEPTIFHCHHYNAFLHRTLLDAEFVDTRPILIGAAAEVAYAQLNSLFDELKLSDIQARKDMAQETFRWSGFGTLDFSSLDEQGGTTRTRNNHYSHAWQVKWGKAKEPVSQFPAGWLAGALAAIYSKPQGHYQVETKQCMAMDGVDECVFELSDKGANFPVFESVKLGELIDQHQELDCPANNVDAQGIFEAVASLPLVGDQDGIIPAFGVYLTRHYANYYNRVSFELERKLVEKFGDQGRKVAAPLLIEAGRVCAFNTFGGIMSSTEWDALVRPQLKSPEDWVHGMLAIVNAFGWGRWSVTSVEEACAEFVIQDDYECAGYLAMYGQADHNVAYLAHGGVLGLMVLVYTGDIAAKPELSEDYYTSIFKNATPYTVKCLESRAQGGQATRFEVRRDA